MAADPEKARERAEKLLLRELHSTGNCPENCQLCKREFDQWKKDIERKDSD